MSIMLKHGNNTYVTPVYQAEGFGIKSVFIHRFYKTVKQNACFCFHMTLDIIVSSCGSSYWVYMHTVVDFIQERVRVTCRVAILVSRLDLQCVWVIACQHQSWKVVCDLCFGWHHHPCNKHDMTFNSGKKNNDRQKKTSIKLLSYTNIASKSINMTDKNNVF